MRRVILLAAGSLVLVAGAFFWWAYSSTQHVPEAYQKMLDADPASQRQASTEMFNRSQRLAKQTKKPGTWNAAFAADEINGYLAVDPERVLARMLPREMSEPRVVVGEGSITMYCRYADGSVSSVLSMEVEPFVSGQRDVLAVRLRDVRAGSLSLPTGRVKEILAEAAVRSELPLRWADEEGDPVALITLPESNGRKVELETLKVQNGEILLAGKTRRS